MKQLDHAARPFIHVLMIPMRSTCFRLWPCLLLAWALPSAAQEPPNIVVIVADDQGYGDTDLFWPQSKIRTPDLARLAAQGIRLTGFRVQPLCASTRASLMTGLFNAGFNQKGPAHEHGVDNRVTFVTEYFRRAGYQVGGFGKWHLGNKDGSHPLDRGFHRWVGFYGGSMPYHYLAGHDHVYEGKATYEQRWQHSTDLFADEAIRFIEANRDRPFFVYLAFNAVHTPLWKKSNPIFSARSDWVKRIRARGVTDPAALDYYAVVEHMDERVGSVLDTLEELGLEQKTLVIYLSDNGAVTPDHYDHFPQMGSNGPYRGGKASPYEGGIRVPFVASWVGVIPANTSSDQASMDADILPTVLEAAGMKLPKMNGPRELNGRSLLAMLKAPGQVTLPTRGTPSRLGRLFAYVEYPWKLVSVNVRIGSPEAKGMEVTNGRLLFNLETDPAETIDVAPLNEERASQMWERYQALYDSLRNPLRD